METLKRYSWYLVFYFLPILAVACGGRVEYDARGGNGSGPGAIPTAPPVDFPSDPVSSDPSPFTGNDGGIAGSSGSGGSGGSSGSGGTVATGGSSGEAGTAGAPADGGTSSDGGTDGDAGAATKLFVSFNGPPTGNAWAGSTGQTMLAAWLTATADDLEIQKMPIVIECEGGGKVRGSKGTPYFTNFQVKSQTQIYMGPIEIPISTPYASYLADLTFTDAWMLLNGQSVNLSISMDVAAQEDAPGELFGHKCRVTLKSLAGQKVKDMVTATMLGSSDVVVNSDIVGNWFTVQQGSLTVNLATNPVSSTHVKKEQNVPTVGLMFTTGTKDVTVSALTLQGQANRGNGFGTTVAWSDLAKDVTVECLYDGVTQMGLCQVPDALNGQAAFTGLNLFIPANSSKIITVKTSLASTVGNPVGDKIAIGIGGMNAVVATDSDGTNMVPMIAADVYAQVTSLSPKIVQTILMSGTLSVVDDSHPASTIVVGGKDVWVPFARYKATAEYESAKIDRVAIGPGNMSGSQDIAALAIAVNGQVLGQDIPPAPGPSNPPWTKDIDLSSNPINIPKDGSVQFEIWAKAAPVMASSIGSWGIARSGDTVTLGLQAGLWTGEWDATYGGMLNVRTTGDISGERLYAPGASAFYGNPMVLRKSKPVVNKLAIATTALANVDTELYKFQISADAAGPIEFAQFALQFEKSSGIAITGLGIRKGSTELMGGNEVWVLTDNPSGLAAGGTGAKVTFQLLPETIVGSGAVFTVHATLQGVTTGQTVTVSFDRVDSATLPMTGTQESPASGPGIHLVPSTNATFIWSDLSEVPHGWDSLDWTNDLYVADLSQTQILFAP